MQGIAHKFGQKDYGWYAHDSVQGLHKRDRLRKRRLPTMRREQDDMKGIQFVMDDQGRKTAVLIDLNEHGELWEDFYDSLLVRSRIDEPRESLESVKAMLKQQGKLDG
ncbi:MAG: hypothetical protein ETSY2_32775 [Candidatus Entotheonella gemina]|uniref:Uncharacterized protein n=2 Tax=Candidatus Entotheonella TaxID=93171 RepID=W4M0M6_9BACT|nr:MAG: hypothetical protein ETSY2_32775 [Candidatus Entotheonella gemina]